MRYILYVGRKGALENMGIHSYIYDSTTHVLTWRRREDDLRGFTHLAITTDGRRLMATGKDVQHEDILVGYAIDPISRELQRIGHVRLNTSNDVCHLDISHDGTIAVVTDFIDKAIHVWSVNTCGAPSTFLARVPFKGSSTSYRQGSSHPHSAFFSTDDRYLFVSDLGANRLWTVRCRRDGEPLPVVSSWKGKDGIGQRHVAVHPDGKHIYALCEITAEVGALELNADGTLREISLQSAIDQPLPEYDGHPVGDIGLPSNYITAGDIVVSPDGMYVFASTRMNREISVFKVMPDGDLKPICFEHTEGTPRCLKAGADLKTLFAFDEESSFTGGKGMIEVFEFDRENSTLTRVAHMSVPDAFIGAVLPIIDEDGNRAK